MAAPIDYALVAHAGFSPTESQTWSMPSATTELFGDIVRVQIDLTNVTQARVYAQIGDAFGPSGAVVFCQYSTNGGTTWSALTKGAAASSMGTQLSPWTGVPSGAKRDVLVRAVASHGNFSSVVIQAFHLQVK